MAINGKVGWFNQIGQFLSPNVRNINILVIIQTQYILGLVIQQDSMSLYDHTWREMAGLIQRISFSNHMATLIRIKIKSLSSRQLFAMAICHYAAVYGGT